MCWQLVGSLLLAEDRVLSVGSVLKTTGVEDPATAFIPEATFYFEAETEAERLLGQRRRWINGTIAGYIWLLQNIGLIWSAESVGIGKKLMLTWLIICQLLMYIVLA